MPFQRTVDVTDSSLPADRARRDLAGLAAMIVGAELELATLHRRLARAGSAPDPSDPFDPVGCLETWLAALRGRREELLRARGEGSIAGRSAHCQAVPPANGDAGLHAEAAALIEALLAAGRRIERLEAEVARLEADASRWPDFDLH
jgi:hypothetical protein